jgi:hypothetical protein
VLIERAQRLATVLAQLVRVFGSGRPDRGRRVPTKAQDAQRSVSRPSQFVHHFIPAGDRAHKFVVTQASPARRAPVGAGSVEATECRPDPIRDSRRKPVCEREFEGMKICRQVFVRRLVDQERPAGREQAPQFADVFSPRLLNVFKHSVCEDKAKGCVGSRETPRISDIRKSYALTETHCFDPARPVCYSFLVWLDSPDVASSVFDQNDGGESVGSPEIENALALDQVSERTQRSPKRLVSTSLNRRKFAQAHTANMGASSG